jgi:hypothetical protein
LDPDFTGDSTGSVGQQELARLARKIGILTGSV